MRSALLAVLVLLVAVTAVPVAAAQTGDSVTGQAEVVGSPRPLAVNIAFDAHSGPSGEQPSGTVGGTVPAAITCLRVVGAEATIGMPSSSGLAAIYVKDNRGAGQDEVGVALALPPNLPTLCPDPAALSAVLGIGPVPITSGDIVVTDAPAHRMVGKGSVPSLSPGGPTASYAYILNCDPTPNAPFEVRFGTQRFRLTSVISSSCTDLNGPIHEGTGSGTLTSGGPGVIQWAFADGGAGGMSDFATCAVVMLGYPPPGGGLADLWVP